MGIFNTWLYAAALLIGGSTALAEETIPREMLLQCEGKSKLFLFDDRKPELHEDSFNMLLRFRDRMVVNPEVPEIVLGRDCRWQNGVIRCELHETLYNQQFNSTQKRRLGVLIVRETRELSHFIETWSFNPAGKFNLNLREQKTGVCWTVQTVGRPMF